jgi:hypothetical protein
LVLTADVWEDDDTSPVWIGISQEVIAESYGKKKVKGKYVKTEALVRVHWLRGDWHGSKLEGAVPQACNAPGV